MFNLNPKKIDWNNEIGSGAFASIYPYQKDQKWVIKKQVAKTFKELLRFFQEIVLGFSFEHFAILPVRGYFIEESSPKTYNIYMKLPRMKKTLKTLIDEHRSDNNKHISEDTLVKILYNLVCGLEYLQNKRIAHRDIKPANILIGEKGEVKLADIGIARFEAEDETLKTIRESTGTLYYMAPELDEAPKKSKDLYKGDMWSLGILMIETCLLRTKIMPQSLPLEQKKEVIKVCITKIEEIYGKEFAGLIMGLVDFDPNQRKSASEIREILQKNYGKILNLKGNEISEAIYIEENKEESYVPYSHGNIKRHKNSAGTIDSFGELMEMEEEHTPGKVEGLQKTLFELAGTMKGLQEKWDKWFTVDCNEKFSLKADERVTDDTIEDYLQDLHTALADLKTATLPKISIGFDGCNQITDTSLKQIGGIVNENFGSVEYLSMKFPNCHHVTDKGMISLVRNIQEKLKNLACLSLNFSGCEGVTSEGFKQLVTLMKDSKTLTKLSLNFKGCPKIDENNKNWAKEQLMSLQKSIIK